MSALALAWVRTCWSADAMAGDPGDAGPRAWLAALESAYEARDLAAYGALLHPAFRFEFSDPAGRRAHPDGWGKDDELASASHLFTGFVDAQGVPRPRADEIALALDDVTVGPDPEHAGDRAHFALVVVAHARLHIGFADGTQAATDDREAYWLVQDGGGTGGRAAAAGAWRARRWVENPADSLLTIQPEPLVAANPATNLPVAHRAGVDLLAGHAFRAVPNPAGVGRRVVLLAGVGDPEGELSGAVFDAAGRLVARLDPRRGPGGAWSLSWDGCTSTGEVAREGVYFARVRFGASVHVLHVVRMR